VKNREVFDLRMRSTDALLTLPRWPVHPVPGSAGDAEPARPRSSRREAGRTTYRELLPMRRGEAPWFLMWCSALLFAFGMIWAWLISISAAQAVTIVDMPLCSALLVGAGVLGTILGQFGMLRAWRRYVRTAEDNSRPVVPLAARSARAPDDERSSEMATKRIEEQV
jgi:hypothetical protein